MDDNRTIAIIAVCIAVVVSVIFYSLCQEQIEVQKTARAKIEAGTSK